MHALTVVNKINQKLQKCKEPNAITKEIEAVKFYFSRPDSSWRVKVDSGFKVEVVDSADNSIEVQNNEECNLIDANYIMLVDFKFKEQHMKEIQIYAVKVWGLKTGERYLKKLHADYGSARTEADRQLKKPGITRVYIECAAFNIDGSKVTTVFKKELDLEEV